jgi:hypothetical protein
VIAVVSSKAGKVTLLDRDTLRSIKVFGGFDSLHIPAFDALTMGVQFRVGPPPQHVVFEGRFAYLTSGYGATIEKVDTASGHVLDRTSAPYGSFELDAADGYVTTSSLLRGTLAVYDSQLKLLRVRALAPAARDVAISRP